MSPKSYQKESVSCVLIRALVHRLHVGFILSVLLLSTSLFGAGAELKEGAAEPKQSLEAPAQNVVDSEQSAATSKKGVAEAKKSAAEKDRWEGFNRRVFAFNEFVDRYALKPAARGYRWVTPSWLDNTVTRFFENTRDLRSGLNNVLQWEWYYAGQNFGRFTVNTTLGVAGIFDVATGMKLRKYPDDLGSTFAVWGVGEGPYLMLPFLGPSMGRDALALWPEDYMRLRHYIDHDLTRYSVTALYVIDVRADLLDLENSIVGDRYSFIRDYYFQSRRLQAGEAPPVDDFGADADAGGWDDAPSEGGDDGW